jgi:hypothetical protein
MTDLEFRGGLPNTSTRAAVSASGQFLRPVALGECRNRPEKGRFLRKNSQVLRTIQPLLFHYFSPWFHPILLAILLAIIAIGLERMPVFQW